MNLLSSSGLLCYSQDDGQYRLVVEVDLELTRYYRSLIPKWLDWNKPRWPSHITVVRPYKETVPNLKPWGKYQGELIEFEYDNFLYNGTVYYWLNIFSNRLEEIRAELGMEVSSPYTKPPEGYIKCFHCTVANCKGF